MSKPYRRRFSNYVLDRTYQLRHAFALVLICGVILSIMGFYWYQEMAVAGEVVKVGVISTMRQGDALRLMEQLEMQAHTRLAVLIGGSVLLCMVVGGFVVVLTHTVAGPLHVIRRRMARIGEGRLDGELRPLRRGDGMLEFYDTFKGMVERLQGDTEEDLQVLERAIARVEDLHDDAAEGDAADLLDELKQLHSRKTDALGS